MHDLAIIGSGPAGLSAAIYCCRAGLRVIVFEKDCLGGQVVNIERVENYPGFPDGVMGSELAGKMVKQAMNVGAELVFAEVTGVEFIGEKEILLQTNSGQHMAKSLIIAGGSHPKRLGVPGEEKLLGKGVSYCAMCDSSYFVNKTVAVVGGSDAALSEALYLSKIASRVIIIARRQLRAQKIFRDRVDSNSKIEKLCGYTVESIIGEDWVTGAKLRSQQTGESITIPVEGVLVYAGLEPNTEFLRGKVALDENGQIIVNEVMETKVPGVFAAGDIRSKSPRQISSAIGDGAIAAASAIKYLTAQ